MLGKIFSSLFGGQQGKPFIGQPVEMKREHRRGGFAVWQWYEVDRDTARLMMAAYGKLTWTVVHNLGSRSYLDVLGLEPHGGKPDCFDNLRTDLLAANLDPANYGL